MHIVQWNFGVRKDGGLFSALLSVLSTDTWVFNERDTMVVTHDGVQD